MGLACAVGLVLGAATLKLSPVLVLAGLAGGLAVVFVTRWPVWGILAMLLIANGLVDSTDLPLIPLGPASLHITDAIVGYLVVLVIIRAVADRRFHPVATPMDTPMIWFVAAVFLAAVMAVAVRGVDASFVLRRLRGLTYYLAFFPITNLIRTRRQMAILIYGMLTMAVFASLVMFVQVVSPSIQIIETRAMELSTAGVEYAGVLRTFIEAERIIYVSLPIMLALLLLVQNGSYVLRLAATGAVGLGVFLTFQRNYWLTTMIALGTMAVLVSVRERTKMVRYGLVVLVVVALAAVLPIQATQRYISAAADRLIFGMSPETLAMDSSTQMRVMETGYALESVERNPLVGVGLGTPYRPATLSDQYYSTEYPGMGLRWYMHNAYLWVLVDMGLLGFLPFLWLYIGAIVRGFKRWRSVPNVTYRAIVLGSTVALLGQSISNIVAPNYMQSWSLATFAALIAINEIIYRWEGPAGRLVSLEVRA
ncbi:MAG: O-antigen ligase family protein [Anaerolineae bacterium]